MAAAGDARKAHPDRWKMAGALRALAMDAVETAKSGHPGMPMGMADVATVLFEKHLAYDPTNPAWPDRDRFVLSAGHGSMLLYGLLHLTGYADMPMEAIRNFRQLHSPAAGHPEFGEAAGIETTTGPLGQGLATAVGMAIAERLMAARFSDKVVDHRTWVIAGDGCLMEGVSQEAIALAGHLKLNRLVVLWDDNGISIDGALSLSDSTDQLKRFEASGWQVSRIDGHDYDAIDAALEEAKTSDKPVLIACKTVIGFGAPKKAGTSAAHGAPLGADELAAAKKAIDWTAKPFEIPADIAKLWKAAGARGAAARAEWEERADKALSDRRRAEFDRIIAGEVPAKLSAAVKRLKQTLTEKGGAMATRKASEVALETIVQVVPDMIGGSADLTGSNNTKTGDLAPITADDFSGRYIYYGIREHGMAAAMNGMALHGGVMPFGGTFLVFADYSRPAIRLAALMKQRVIHVLTHDSIGLGEDGPTHQPVEHVASLRAIPNLAVYRPADAVETAECWELAVSDASRPSALALTRQNLPLLRTDHTTKNMAAQGAYVIADCTGSPKALLLATGSEVEIAVAAKAILEKDGVPTRVISMPSFERFAEQDEKYRKKILPRGPIRVAVEAGIRQPWDQWLTGERGDFRKAAFVGMDSFGASAPAGVLYEHFGITAEKVAEAAKALL